MGRQLPQWRRWPWPVLVAAALSVGFALWLASGWGGPGRVKVGDNLAAMVAPLLAALACARAAVVTSGRVRSGWSLLAVGTFSWGAGQGAWLWYELIALRDVPFPSLADLGFLGFYPLTAAAMLLFPGPDGRSVWRIRTLLDGAIVAAALLYASWAFVLGPVFRAEASGLFEQAIALGYPAGDVVIVAIVFGVLGRRGRVPTMPLGAGLLCMAVADTAFAYLTQAGTYHTGVVTDSGWIAGFLLLGAAALHRPAAHRREATAGRGVEVEERARALLPYAPLALAVGTSVTLQLRGQGQGPFLYWTFAVLVVLIVVRQLAAVIDNQRLNRQLAAMVDQLHHEAFHDRLTGLPNRALFFDRAAHALARRRREPAPMALLYVDLDDFKTVNDALGHAAGDELLAAVADRLDGCVRQGDTVARLGGDEFAILLDHGIDHDGATDIAERIVAALAEPFQLAQATVTLTASVGVALGADASIEDALRDADSAMYTAKAHGKGRYELAVHDQPPATASAGKPAR
jgi:diguanylate cyclase (GGDEF)-like protein